MKKNKTIWTLLTLLLCGCATRPTDPEQLKIYEANNDPMEPMNRAFFEFNMQADKYILKPITKGYMAISPEFVQQGGINFFDNLKQPIYLINALLEWDLTSAGQISGRFATNTVLGCLGLFNPATELEIPVVKRTFGDTLAVWGVENGGPYLVIPILGPSNIRDGIGSGVDYFTALHPWFLDDFWVKMGMWGVEGVHYRLQVMDLSENLQQSSTDLYATMRSMYQQNRQKKINELLGKTSTDTATKPDYDFDFPEDEEE